MQKLTQTLTIPDSLAGLRLDQALTKLLPDYSRTQLQEWIKQGAILINNNAAKAKAVVLGGETITINAELKAQPYFKPQPIALNIIYEDKDILVINKPVGMVVHPGAGNMENTLLNALLNHAPELQQLPRAGIIHRLDKNTTGLLVIAKTNKALHQLTHQLKARSIKRIYQAIVNGILLSGGTIDQPIARHPVARKRMAIIDTGKEAITHYRIIERYRAHTRIKIQLETGRTHQIRVHMAHIHHAVLGDPTYGGRLQLPKGATNPLVTILRQFKRQALHAVELTLTHPETQEPMTFTAPLPADMQELIDILKKDNEEVSDE